VTINYNNAVDVTTKATENETSRSFTAYAAKGDSLDSLIRRLKEAHPGAKLKPKTRVLKTPGAPVFRGRESRSTLSNQETPANWMTSR